MAKKWFVWESARNNLSPGKANSHFNPTKWSRGSHHRVKAAVDWCRSCYFLWCLTLTANLVAEL